MLLDKICIITIGLIAVIRAGKEDDGSAFKFKWTAEDVANCEKTENRPTKKCDSLKARSNSPNVKSLPLFAITEGDEVSVPDLETCKKSYDENGEVHCKSFRGPCWTMYIERKEGGTVPSWGAAVCSEAWARKWTEFANGAQSTGSASSNSGAKTKTASESETETETEIETETDVGGNAETANDYGEGNTDDY